MSKTILITGASSGIGRSTAHLFASKGYQLILTARREDKLHQVIAEIQARYPVDILPLIFDVQDARQVQEAIQSIPTERFPTIDVLLNNAGLALGMGPIDQGDLNDWDTMIDTNIKGLLYVTKAVVPTMKSQGYGHIIQIGSTAGKVVYQNGNVYCATKHAVDALNQSMRIDLLPYGIKVSAVNPGACETEFSLVRFKGDENRAKSVYDGFQPLGPDDVAQTILYLAELPAHVCINDVTLTCLDQANAIYLQKNKT